VSTKIEWATEVWNPVTGCTKVSPGCANCYIERQTPMRVAGRRFVRGKIPIELHPDRLNAPLRWRTPRRVFVNSMSDLFHDDIDEKYIAKVMAICELAYWHQFLILTKRPERMRRLMLSEDFQFHIGWFASMAVREFGLDDARFGPHVKQTPPNVWLGVSVENQRMADERIPLLLETPAAVRFLSCEPLLGPVDLRAPLQLYGHNGEPCCTTRMGWHRFEAAVRRENPPPYFDMVPKHALIDWVIVGGESGGPDARRLVEHVTECVDYDRISGSRYAKVWRPKPEAFQWVVSLRDQCKAAGVPFFFKQWGGPTPRSGGRALAGRDWNEYPA
jgi:protein gp37